MCGARACLRESARTHCTLGTLSTLSMKKSLCLSLLMHPGCGGCGGCQYICSESDITATLDTDKSNCIPAALLNAWSQTDAAITIQI